MSGDYKELIEFISDTILRSLNRIYSTVKSDDDKLYRFVERNLPDDFEDVPWDVIRTYMMLVLLRSAVVSGLESKDLDELENVYQVLREGSSAVVTDKHELEELKESHIAEVADLRTEVLNLSSENDKLKRELELLQAKYDNRNSECEEQLEAMNKTHEHALSVIRGRRDAKIKQIETDCQIRIDRALKDFREVTTLQKQAFREDLDKLEKVHSRAITRLKNQHKRKLQVEYSIRSSTRCSQYIFLKRSYFWQLRTLMYMFNSELSSIRSECNLFFDGFKREYAGKLKILSKGNLSKVDIEKLTLDTSWLRQRVSTILDMEISPKMSREPRRHPTQLVEVPDSIPPEAFGSNTGFYSKNRVKSNMSEDGISVVLNKTVNAIKQGSITNDSNDTNG